MACAPSPTNSEEDSILDCALCMSTYQAPKALPCLHSFCLQCLEQYVSVKSAHPLWGILPCPLCRQIFYVPSGGVAALPNNFFINTLLEKEKKKAERRSVLAVAVLNSSDGGEKANEGVPSPPNNMPPSIRPSSPPILPSNVAQRPPNFAPLLPNTLQPPPLANQLRRPRYAQQQPPNVLQPAQYVRQPINVPPPSISIPPPNFLPSPRHILLSSRSALLDQSSAARSFGGTATMIMGFSTRASNFTTNEQKLVLVNLATPNRYSILSCRDLPTPTGNESAACVIDNDLYAVGIGLENSQLWKWSSMSRRWSVCSNMPVSRRQHSVTSVGKTLYVLGGWESIDKRAVDTIYSYDTTTNTWNEEDRKLKCAVNNAVVGIHDSTIHLFGGCNKFNSFSNRVQQFDLQRRRSAVNYCTYVMPSKIMNMKAVQWKDKFILLGSNACYVFVPGDKHKWVNRDNFRTGKAKFWVIVQGETVYVVSKTSGLDSYEVEKMDAANIVQNKFVPWRRHAVISMEGELNFFCTQPLLL